MTYLPITGNHAWRVRDLMKLLLKLPKRTKIPMQEFKP